MAITQQSPAVATALTHVQAWSNRDFDKARSALASDVTVTATTTKPIMKPTHLTGIEDYMTGLVQFAQAVVPGSLRVDASTGDERNALLMVTVDAAFGPGGQPVPLPGARLYRLDDQGKIAEEQVIFLIPD